MTPALFLRARDKGKRPIVQPKKPKKGPSKQGRKTSTFIEKSSMNRKQVSKRVEEILELQPVVTGYSCLF